MKKLGVPFAAAVLMTFGAGCGGNQPLDMILRDPVIDESTGLALPVSTSVIATVNAFSSSNDGFSINYQSFTGQPVVTAPLRGTVVNVDTSVNPGFTAVTIFHNPRLTSRVSFLQIASVRQGDFVEAGTQIGSLPQYAGGLSGIKLSVYIDGSATAVCPLSYLSSAARTTFTTAFGGNFPCLQ